MPTLTQRVMALDPDAPLPPERPVKLRPRHAADYALAYALALSARAAALRGDYEQAEVLRQKMFDAFKRVEEQLDKETTK